MARAFVIGLDGIEAMSTAEGDVINTQTDPGVQTIVESNMATNIENPNFEAPAQEAALAADLDNLPSMDA